MKTPYSEWFRIFRKIILILDRLNIGYMVFGAAAYVLWVEPVSTKDIDILLHPFPTEEEQELLIESICESINCIQKIKSIDAWEGNRLIINARVGGSVVGIEFWEKILRSEVCRVFERRVTKTVNSLKIHVIALEDLLASKICDLTPEPLDRDKIDKILAKWGGSISVDKVTRAIIEFHQEATAVYNILNWYPNKIPRPLKQIIKGLIRLLSVPIRNEVIKILEERGDPIGLI